MSCDLFPGHVEKNMRRLITLNYFKDFVAAVQTSGGGPRTIEKKSHNDTTFNECNFYMKKTQQEMDQSTVKPRGIPQ